jgi:lipopolysaccharide export system permease protein
MWNRLFPLVYERYLAKQIYLSFAFILFALISLFVFFDFITEMNDTSNVYTILMAFLTVLFRIPGRVVEIMPIAALIGGIYVCTNMAAQSEYTILRVAGLAPLSALKTLLKIAIPIVICTIIFSEAISPLTEKLSRNIKISAFNSGKEVVDLRSGAWIKDKRRSEGAGAIEIPGLRYINVGMFESGGIFKGVRIYEFDENHRLTLIRNAETVVATQDGLWELNNVKETYFTETKSMSQLDPNFTTKILKIDKKYLSTDINPQLLSGLLIQPDKMSIWGLFSYIRHLYENKQDYQRYAISFWKKVIYPFTILVMLALALPFAYLQTRSGAIGYKVFGGIMLGISFQLFNSLFSHLGLLGEWPALVSAITPAMIYFILALVGIRWVSKV